MKNKNKTKQTKQNKKTKKQNKTKQKTLTYLNLDHVCRWKLPVYIQFEPILYTEIMLFIIYPQRYLH